MGWNLKNLAIFQGPLLSYFMFVDIDMMPSDLRNKSQV